MKIELDAQGCWTDAEGKRWKLVPKDATKEMIDVMNMPWIVSDGMYACILDQAPLPTIKTRYDWSRIRGEWAATDGSGNVYGYRDEPTPSNTIDIWVSKNCSGVLAYFSVASCPDWRESLEQRP